MSKELMIGVYGLTKVYKMYEKPLDRLKESLSITHKQYSREFYALNDINFEVRKGECIGIIGTNGSGKSTLLKIITGVLNPTFGDVIVNGKVSALLELGAGFNPEYTGVENIYLNGTMMGYTREEVDAKVDEILQFADIGDFAYQPVKTYSSGMFVRLAFAVAINVNPDILIVDEALSVGDYKFQSKCYRKFEEFREQGKTILLVTHDVDTIKKFCSRAIWIERGNLRLDGGTKEVTSLYIKSLHQNDDAQTNLNLYDTVIDKQTVREMTFDAIARFGTRNDAVKYVDLFDSETKHLKVTEMNVSLELEIEVDVRKEDLISDNVTIAFSIKNKKGQDVFVYSLLDDGIKISEPGRHIACFKFDNFLTPEEYYISASYEIRDGVTPEYIDYVDGAYYFKVVSEKVCYGMVNIPVQVEAQFKSC